MKRYIEPVNRVYTAGSILLSAMLLLSAAFYNGYPLVTADIATYLNSGFILDTPNDRPIGYGLLLRAASLDGVSLWPVVVLQALMVSTLLYGLLKQFLPRRHARAGLPLVAALLTLLTPLSWVVSSLMPDIFTPVALLCLLLICIANPGTKLKVALYVLYFVSICMHMSHVLLFGVLIILFFLLRRWIAGNARKEYFGIARMSSLLLLTAAAIASMGSALSKSRHVFFMGAMVERGVTQTYLQEYCPTIPYRICAFKDKLPDRGYAFVWESDGALHHSGGWEGSKEEFNKIIRATFTKPKYIWLHIRSSLIGTYLQLGQFAIGDGNSEFGPESNAYAFVKQHVPGEISAFSTSLQNSGDLLPLPAWQSTIYYSVMFSWLGLLLVLHPSLRQYLNMRIMLCFLIAGVVINAWDCATFANVINRLGARMVWLVVLADLVMIATLLSRKTLVLRNEPEDRA